LSEPGAARRVVIRFAVPRSIGPASLVALEDYARELCRARAAEALAAEADATRTCGLSLEAPLVAPEGDVLADIEAFARDLAEREGPGLGWS
jgi:hypothetical protein